MGRRRRARRRPDGAAGGPAVPVRLAVGRTRPGGDHARALRRPGIRPGRLPELRGSGPHRARPVRRGDGVPAREPRGRASRGRAGGRGTFRPLSRRARPRTRLGRHAGRPRGEPGRPFPRLDPRQDVARGPRGHDLAATPRKRSGAATAPASPSGRGPGPGPGGLPLRRSAHPRLHPAAARDEGDGRPRRRDELPHPGRLPPARGRGGGGPLPARPLPRQGDAGLGRIRRRKAQFVAGHPRLGLQLAGRVPLRPAGVPAGGRHPRHGVQLRQLGGKPPKPARSAPPGALRARVLRRDGRPLGPGRSAARRGSRGAEARLRAEGDGGAARGLPVQAGPEPGGREGPLRPGGDARRTGRAGRGDPSPGRKRCASGRTSPWRSATSAVSTS